MEHRNATIVTMLSSDDAIRARMQTELLFMHGFGLCIVAWILLWMLSTWLTWQLRRLEALKYWRQLSKSHFDGIFTTAFKKYGNSTSNSPLLLVATPSLERLLIMIDDDGDGKITQDELMKAVKTALGTLPSTNDLSWPVSCCVGSVGC